MSSLHQLLLLSFLLLPFSYADLRLGFYRSSCPQAESIVQQVVRERFNRDRSITAAFLRMHFHDCFVSGCDASILIDATAGKPSEKNAGPNLTVRGNEVIDEIKRRLEQACPSTVSCADIITLATRDSVVLSGGPNYDVPTGRQDGLVSNPDNVNLPGPTLSVSQALQSFTEKGFNLAEMVTLLGAHSVGFSHCSFFQDRLTDFQGTGAPDRNMDPALVTRLRDTCAQPNDPTVFLDQGTPNAMDNKWYSQLIQKRGILQIDQALAIDRSSASIVSGFASNDASFRQRFAAAMIKMGSLQLNGPGEIRKNCRAFNKA
nr:peroxidase [Melianthus elongatus]